MPNTVLTLSTLDYADLLHVTTSMTSPGRLLMLVDKMSKYLLLIVEQLTKLFLWKS